MPSLTTVYRAVVMIATGFIVVKGWQLYGPSAEQVKTVAAAALEKAQAAWNGSAGQEANSTAAVDPRSAIPPIAETSPPPAIPAAPIEPAPQLVPVPEEGAGSLGSTDSAAPAAPAPAAPSSDQESVAKLLAQLEQLGAADAQVVPWGSSGELYRCFCRAKLAESSPLARHFEAVAGAPTAAVEQVVAKVEAWRTAQQNLLR